MENLRVRPGCGLHTLPKSPEDAQCTKYFDAFLHCFSLRGVLKAQYRTGTFDGCVTEIENFHTCLKLKVLRPEKGQELLDDLHARREAQKKAKNLPDPPWQMRTSPPPDFQSVAPPPPPPSTQSS